MTYDRADRLAWIMCQSQMSLAFSESMVSYCITTTLWSNFLQAECEVLHRARHTENVKTADVGLLVSHRMSGSAFSRMSFCRATEKAKPYGNNVRI